MEDDKMNIIIIQYLYIQALHYLNVGAYYTSLETMESAEKMIKNIPVTLRENEIIKDVLEFIEGRIVIYKKNINEYLYEPDQIMISPASSSDEDDKIILEDSIEVDNSHEHDPSVFDEYIKLWQQCKLYVSNICIPIKFKID